MKLARIILPERDNDNQSLAWQHQALQDLLVANFGGFTMTKGHGAWEQRGEGWVRTKHEAVCIYDIAMSLQDTPKLREIAGKVAADAKQDCVMIVTPNGDVDFVKPLKEIAA